MLRISLARALAALSLFNLVHNAAAQTVPPKDEAAILLGQAKKHAESDLWLEAEKTLLNAVKVYEKHRFTRWSLFLSGL